ncbi:MAG: hypothetical protein A2798_01435 [Candidatus Levybacteria bacterium RIFCSPHIGHO2_01_FULL_37_17]|nr:MAG: hypothetical protein A2798_01435 [Candidatus Levybacteria bacterium RIFCSPHIGHO2_01_FULL_37_17]OGH37111.1 MAG: hypothetical protein A2959_02295 [Candidatus Levybacteria bacterium RIFCSPLOWO2_01_FULL_38_23]
MNKIITANQAKKISQDLKNHGKKLVLCGGIFDILHIGHIRFLQKAKRQKDVLLVLLESDSRAKKEKGNTRPINPQAERAEILASLIFVDYVIMLEDNFKDYDGLIAIIKPDVIAVTSQSTTLIHAKRQGEKVGAKVIEVIPRIKNKSTTKIADIVSKSF